LTYEQRLKKYAMRGFAVVLPVDVDLSRVSPAIFTMPAMASISARFPAMLRFPPIAVLLIPWVPAPVYGCCCSLTLPRATLTAPHPATAPPLGVTIPV
jgi:hypothetical protein